ncbi:MAG: oligoendopeptidase F [Pseudomonadota bacterium]
MMRPTRLARFAFLVPLTLGITLMTAAAARAGERKDVPDKYKWNLADLYPSEDAWTKAKEALGKRLPELAKFQGKLGKSPKDLLAALETMYGVDRDLSRLSVYASTLSDEDVRAPRPREMKQAAEEIITQYAAAVSWVRPEIQSLPPAKVRGFVARESKLAPYRMFLEDTLRRKPHTLGAAEEKVAAEASEMQRTGSEVHGVLSNADLPYPTVKLSTGESVRLDASAFTLHRQARDRADRDKVFTGFFGALKTYERTMGATLAAGVKAHLFEKRVHKYDSALQAALFQDNIPPVVYKQLLADVHRSLPTLHRYLALRKKMLGLDVLRYQDLYVPLVASVDMKFGPDEAREITLEALAPLGKTYTDALRKGFDSRWTDYLPSPGKRSGAYSTGVYGVHPYQLLNFNGRYEDLTTLAHEAGHSMHTFLSHGAQPYPTADYPIFVAEVASTFNENLLIHHMLGRAKDDATRLFLLGTLLDGLRTTLFRQTQFADFELAFHEQAERGEPLTGENLSALYLKIARDYYGHAKKVCVVDDLLAVEWAYVPHFYYGFYVYQYATSMVASTSLARAVREEAAAGGGKTTARRDAYLKMLSSGSSKYAIDQLKEAGVDMTTSGPFDAAIAEMNATMDEMEKILKKTGKGERTTDKR